MSIDLSKLTPASYWQTDDWDEATFEWFKGASQTDREFVGVARRAFDVMMRRGWSMERTISGTWALPLKFRWVADGKLWDALSGKCYPDPFTALIEADKWYKENVEAVSK